MTKISGVMATCFLCICAAAVAQTPSVNTFVSVQTKTEQAKHFWTYKITWTGELVKDKKVGIRFKVPKDYSSPQIEGAEKPIGTEESGGFWQWVFTVAETEATEKKVTMIFSGPETKLRQDGFVEWAGEYDMTSSDKGVAAGPELAFDPSRFRIVLAAGTDFGLDDFVDFTEQDAPVPDPAMMMMPMTTTMRPFLLTVNDSRTRASALVGGAFRLGKMAGKPWEAVASLQFTDNTDRTLDGFFFGASYGVQKYLSIGGGYSLRLGKELSRGFQRDAARFVIAEGMEERFPVLPDKSGLVNDKAYDGLPLTNSMGQRWFPGSPIIESFNHSLFIGLFFPIDIAKAIKGAGGP